MEDNGIEPMTFWLPALGRKDVSQKGIKSYGDLAFLVHCWVHGRTRQREGQGLFWMYRCPFGFGILFQCLAEFVERLAIQSNVKQLIELLKVGDLTKIFFKLFRRLGDTFG